MCGGARTTPATVWATSYCICPEISGSGQPLCQWIVVGGVADDRDRPSEFAARGERSLEELIELVETRASEVDRTLADLKEATLVDRITVQGFSVTRLHAIYHSIEHFGYHLGQIAYIAKLRTGKDFNLFP